MKKSIILSLMFALTAGVAFAQCCISRPVNVSTPAIDASFTRMTSLPTSSIDASFFNGMGTENFNSYDRSFSPINASLTKLSATENFWGYDKNLPTSGKTTDDIPAIGEYNTVADVAVINPVAGDLMIISPDNIMISKVEVYDRLGALQLVETVNGGSFQVPAGELKTGVYFIRIYAGNETTTKEVYKL